MSHHTLRQGATLVTIGLVAAVGARTFFGRKRARGAAAMDALRDFKSRYDAALADPQLRGNLLRYQRTWRRQRDGAFDSYESRTGRDFGTMRHELAVVKDGVISNLPGHFQQFKEAAERNGAVVYQASDPADAGRYIVELAKRHGVQLVTKSKSMVSEEINLNHILEANGLHVVETDFGEYVVHLSKQRPSHMISPIAHLNRYQVGKLLSEDTGLNLSGEDINALTVAARARLREMFLFAEMGISGANALIAESGTVMLVTNEGNAELTTSLPDVHVVITGYEKLLPTFADAMLELRLLARSGTGQQITSYTTFVTGPDRPGREVHFVFVDNGRSQMRSDPNFVDVLRCIRCGACANVCPPYQVVSGHVFGYIYAGAVGLVTTPFHHGIENDAGPQSLCVQCNACATVCPVEIPLPRQILDTRRKVVEWEGLPWYKRLAFELWSRPDLFDGAARAAAVLQKPLVEGRFIRKLPLPESLAWRTTPALAAIPARDRLIGRKPTPAMVGPIAGSAAKGLTVAYFIQCLTDRFLPEMAEATVRVIEACGASVIVPEGQHCCGLPAYDSGDNAHARAMAEQTIRWLEHISADYVVSGAASCVIMITRDYEHLFAGDTRWLRRAERISRKVIDLTTFLDKVAQLPKDSLNAGPFPPVTYHYFCQSHNVLGMKEEPRRLITEVMGLDLIDMNEASTCCGFGGSVSIDHPGVSRHIVERKLDNIDATGAPLVITDNPGCILHLRGSVDASGRQQQVIHLAELVDERLSRVAR